MASEAVSSCYEAAAEVQWRFHTTRVTRHVAKAHHCGSEGQKVDSNGTELQSIGGCIPADIPAFENEGVCTVQRPDNSSAHIDRVVI